MRDRYGGEGDRPQRCARGRRDVVVDEIAPALLVGRGCSTASEVLLAAHFNLHECAGNGPIGHRLIGGGKYSPPREVRKRPKP